MAPAPPATVIDKIGILGVTVKTVLAALTRLLTTPLRSSGHKVLFKDVAYAALRTQLSSLNISQENYMQPGTEANYFDLAKKHGFQPDSEVLPSGCKAFWLGNKSADKVMLYLHGGGYVMPASPAHLGWVLDVTQTLSKEHSFSCLFLGYTCAPEAQYPTQLGQAAEALQYLLEKEGKKPSDIIIGGDSAGGNLTLALLSHILHPHPRVSTKIKLNEPLRGALLISPWVKFGWTDASWKTNFESDILTPETAKRWSSAFIGDAPLDNYAEPIRAESDWFSGLDSIVSDILVWGGGGEVLIDSINAMAERLKTVHKTTEYVVEPDVGHEEFIIERLLTYTRKAQGTELIEHWISSKL